MTLEVIIGVLTNLFSSAVYDVIVDPAVIDEDVRTTTGPPPRGSDAYNAVVKDAAQRFAPQLRKVDPEGLKLVEQFVRSDELKQVTLQLFRTRLAGPQYSIAELRQVAAGHWAAVAGDRHEAFSPFDFFDALTDAASKTLQRAMKENDLVAHESMSSARFTILQDRLNAITAQLRSLQEGTPTDLKRRDGFLKDLRAAVADAHEWISPPSLRGAADVKLNDIYVAPNFRIGAGSTVSFKALKERTFRLVLLGTPGAGKSTFAKKLALDLATRRGSLSGDLRPVAIFMELRGYVKHCETMPCSLREYVELYCKTHYQLDPPEGAVEDLLIAGRIAVFFDGLDELPRVAERVSMKARIEAFARRYAQTPIVVTSRAIGYEFAALDRNRFESVHVESFNEAQIRQYASRWFAADGARSGTQDREISKHFVQESGSVADLRANPLLLGLMCTLYRGKGYIPKNRPELYSACADLLFDTWDSHRGIDQLRPFEDLLRPTMRHLALWIYTTASLQSGITGPDAVRRTATFLQEQRFDDPLRAERAAQGFIEFCRGRAWVFSDVGADSHHHDVFKFTHRTFLEFFAAEQILSDCQTDTELESVLRPHIEHGEWEVVARLCLHMRSRQHLNSADGIVERLLSHGGQSDFETRVRVVSFAMHLLGEVGMKPRTVDRICDEVFRVVFGAQAGSELEESKALLGNDLLMALLRCDPENRDRAIAAWVRAADDFLGAPLDGGGGKADRAFGVELAGCVPSVFATLRPSLTPEAFGSWSEALSNLSERAAGDYVPTAPTPLADLRAYRAGWITAGALFRVYGFAAFLIGDPNPVLREPRPPVLIELLSGSAAFDTQAVEAFVASGQSGRVSARKLNAVARAFDVGSYLTKPDVEDAGRTLVRIVATEHLAVQGSPLARAMSRYGEDRLRKLPLSGQMFAARVGVFDPSLALGTIRRTRSLPGRVASAFQDWVRSSLDLTA